MTGDAGGTAVRPVRITVGADVLGDLRDRLRRTRWPDDLPGAGWDYGTDQAYLRDLCRYWERDFDWGAAEARLNTWDHFRTGIDGEDLHFLHAVSPHPGALPLLLCHGWPGSIVEFESVIAPLVDPVAHGGDAADAFSVVCPSLPGYTWSGPTRSRGWHVGRVADAFAALMARLGYDRYGAQGGDWGGLIVGRLGLVDPAHLAGIHLNYVRAGRPAGSDDTDLDAAEAAALAERRRTVHDTTGYSAIQSTRPLSVAYGLVDSPAGLAGWIVEKFRAWSDCDGDLESVFSRDTLLTNVTAYWATGTAGSSARLYYESARAGMVGPLPARVEVPTAVAAFPREIFVPPRSWVAAAYDLQRWTPMPRGGHFAALEQPDLLVDDIRAFFRTLR